MAIAVERREPALSTTHRNDPALDGEDTFRITGSDVDQLVSWQAGLRARLPAGSQYVTAMRGTWPE